MTEKTPIKPEDIRQGDLIRIEYRPGNTFSALEYTAKEEAHAGDALTDDALFLLYRPISLPTAPGLYLDKDGDVWQVAKAGKARLRQRGVDEDGLPEEYAPYQRLEAVSVTLARVDEELRRNELSLSAGHLARAFSE
ncbi:hypothetical protein [Lysinibacter cavernae]|uniref:Uncharacterized protein n=1 Tax=Lysinibacter cavernae TaxID=1640652 RepID=A0A7X5QYV8_9MICO|nr:hypothetical protein [Lysinibacter cavernae]NIH52513.1 hypothetical protein [Lysinibacter cavernae]